MLGNILGSTPNERRPNAEFVRVIRQRWTDVYEAVDLEHAAERRVFPNMFVEPVVPVSEAAPVSVPSEVVTNVINMANQHEFRVLNEQERRLADARMAAEEAHNETAA